MEDLVFDYSAALQENIKDEAEASESYVRLLKLLNNLDIPEEDKNAYAEHIKEIIADELNHMKVLKELFYEITGIKAKVD